MKRIYLLAFALSAAIGVSAQYKHSPATLGRQTLGGEVARPQNDVVNSGSRNLNIFYTNDFSNCSQWTTGNANTTAGLTQYIAGINFVCGTAGPSGPAAIAPIASTTAANGFMKVDSDLFGGSAGGDWVENCWFQNAQPINCSAYDHVSIRFQTFYRMWDNGSSDGNEYCLVEVSTDGVTWPDLNTFEVDAAPAGTRYELWPLMETQDPVDNPTTIVFDITQAAANQSTVYLRFRWKGTWGYAWMVDDLEVFETPANDLTLAKIYNGDIVNDYEYSEIPTSQVVEVVAGAVIANYGYIDQPDVNVTFDINGETSTGNGAIAPSTVGQIWSGSMPVSNSVGTKTLTVTLPADDDDTGNVLTKSFEVTQFDYAHVSNATTIQRTLNSDAEVAFGSTFVINQNAQAGGIRVHFGPLTAVGSEIQAIIYQVGANIQDLTYLGASQEMVVTQAMIDAGGYVDIGFNLSGPVQLQAGFSYVAELRKYDGPNRVYLRADQIDEDLSTVCYGPFGTGGVVNWFVGWGFAPALKLSLNPALDVVERTIDGVELSQNMPNPSNGNTIINYTLEASKNVQLIIRDMAGRIVSSESFGNRAPGTHTVQLNTNQYGAGIYSYTLIAGETQITKQMMVR